MNPGAEPSGGQGGGLVTLDSALQRFRDVLAADGYTLEWSVDERDRVVVRILAGEDACADCLVPLPVMESIMSDALSATPYTLDRIVLPASA